MTNSDVRAFCPHCGVGGGGQRVPHLVNALFVPAIEGIAHTLTRTHRGGEK